MLTDTPTELADPREKKRYYFDYTTFRRVLTPTIQLLFKTIAVIHSSGTEHLPKRGAVILAGNHLTNFDVFPMQFSIERPIFFMAKSELHQNLIMDPILRHLGAFPVQRGQRDEWAMQHAQRVLEHGSVLGMFPEGTRSKGKGLRPAKTGAARLALAVNCPLIPVALTGTHQMFTNFPRRSHIHITFGSPIFPHHNENSLALTDRLMFALAAMLPPELRGAYAERPDWLH